MCIIVLMEVKLAPWVGLFFAITDYRRPPTSIFIPPAENVSNKAWFLGLGLFKIYPVVFHFTLQNNNYCLFLASCFSNQNYWYNISCIFVSFYNINGIFFVSLENISTDNIDKNLQRYDNSMLYEEQKIANKLDKYFFTLNTIWRMK